MLERHPLVIGLLMVFIGQVLFAMVGVSPILSGDLLDSDCYSRLVRVLQLHESGAWWTTLDPRINVPFGETLQWTRPLDVLIEMGAEPLGWILPYRQALFIWGALISPILLVITVVVLWAALGRRLGAKGFLLLVLLLHASPALIGTFLIGRPDHHSLLALLFIGQILLVLSIAEGRSASRCGWLGAIGGLALWVSIEAAVPQAYFGICLTGLWLARRIDAGCLAAYGGALFATTAVAIAIEFPPALWWVPAYDRISVVQATLLGLTALMWTGIAFKEPAGMPARLLSLAGVGAVLAITSALAFPKLLVGPFVEHGEIARAWLMTVREWQPLWPTDRVRAASMFTDLGPALVVIPWLIVRRREPAALILLLGCLLFIGCALSANRWSSYAQAMFLLPWVDAVWWLWNRSALPMRRLVATLAVTAGFVLALLVNPLGQAGARAVVEEGCPIAPLATHLRGLGGRDQVLMTYLFIGPELEWRTDFDLIGIPSANEATITDTLSVLGAEDENQAAGVLRRRGVDYLLLCPTSGWAKDYRKADGRTLHQRLERGDLPPWLSPIVLPSDLAGFRLYRVDLK